MKNKILLFIKVPPPLTGATLMNTYVSQSKLLDNSYNIKKLLVSYAKDLEDLGKLSIRKLGIVINTINTLLKILFKEKVDLVYFQISPLGLSFLRDCLYILIIKLSNTKIVFHLHGKGIEKASKNIFLRYLYKWAFKNNDIICLSNLLTYDVKNVFTGVPYIISNGIPYLNNKQSKIINNKTINILFLSNLIKTKGILDFIDALYILKERQIIFQAFIVGKEGDLSSDQLKKLILKKNLYSVIKYLGPKYNSEKIQILKQSDILVFPTHNDSFPLVILEAMQFGIPIITTKEGAIPEIVEDGITGFLVEKQNSQQIAEKIEILVKNHFLRKKMGEAARKKYLENYNLEIFEQNLNCVFDDILNKNLNKNRF